MLHNVIIVRHAESYGNLHGPKYWGNDDINFLTKRGVVQAQLAGLTLYDLQMPIAHVYSSPMLRARQTCNEIVHYAHIDTDMIILDDLRECEESQSKLPETTCKAFKIITDARNNGNVLITMHGLSMVSLLANFGLKPGDGGQCNANLNIIDSENNLKVIWGNQDNPLSHLSR